MTTRKADALTALRGRLALKCGDMEFRPGSYRWSVRYYRGGLWIKDAQFAAGFVFILPTNDRVRLRDAIPCEVYDDDE